MKVRPANRGDPAATAAPAPIAPPPTTAPPKPRPPPTPPPPCPPRTSIVGPLAIVLLVPAIPGLTGDSASARWLATVDNVSSAAATPSRRNASRNEKRARSEIAIIRVTLLLADGDRRQLARRAASAAFSSSRSTCDLFAGWYSWI